MANYFNPAYANTYNCKMYYNRSVAADISVTYAVGQAMPVVTAKDYVQADPRNIPFLGATTSWYKLVNPLASLPLND